MEDLENLNELLEIIAMLEKELKREKGYELSSYGKYELNKSDEEDLDVVEEEEEVKSFDEGDLGIEIPVGAEVELEDGKQGVVIKRLDGGKFLVEVQTPEKKIMVFSANKLKVRGQHKPGDVVRRKETGEEYTVVEVDEGTGKAKVKSKTTGEEQYVDVEYLEKMSRKSKVVSDEVEIDEGLGKVSQVRPYEKPQVKIMEDEGVEGDREEVEEEKEEKVEVEREDVSEEERGIEEEEVEERVKGDEEGVKEVMLTETVKSVFTDPEIAVIVVEKLLDLISERGLEVQFAKKLSSYGVDLDDLLCGYCYLRKGVKLASVFVSLLGGDVVSRVIKKVMGRF